MNMINTRNSAIDLIRGLSVLSVILLHCYISLPLEQTFFSERLMNIFFRSGYYGVMTFFVVSGFLITSTSFRKWGDLQTINPVQFYQMRFARIMPCLVAFLAILSLFHLMGISSFVIHTTTLQHALFSALTFNINWLEAKTGYMPVSWTVLWSLSIEEVFYLFFPILCITLKNKMHLIAVMLVFIVIGPFARTIFTDNDIWADHSYLSCMDGIAIGCLGAMFANKARSLRLLVALLISGIILFGFIFLFRKQAFDSGLTSHGLNVTMLEIGIAFILIAAQQIKLQSHVLEFKPFKFICWFGRNSYEIYLSHCFVILAIVNVLYQTTQPTIFILFEYFIIVLCSGLLGQTIAYYYSEPLNRMLRRDLKATLTTNSKEEKTWNLE